MVIYPIHPAGSKRISTSDIRGVLLDNMGVKRKAGGMFSFKVGDSLMQFERTGRVFLPGTRRIK